MASYGRNFDMRVPARGAARNGRFVTAPVALSGGTPGGGAAGTGTLPIGAPVVSNLGGGQDPQGRQYVMLATQDDTSNVDEDSLFGGSAWDPEPGPVVSGLAGILVYEYGPAAFAGFDPYLTTYSDLGTVPLGTACQVISGDPTVKVVFRNTVASSFLGIRPYAGRTMVNGFGATATVAVGDYLVPGIGDDTNGYWQSTASEEGAWLVITGVDTIRLEVEARMLF